MQLITHKVINTIILLIVSFNSYAQFSFYQDIFKGGICVTGTASWNASDTITLPYFIEPQSNIKKIFLITYAMYPVNGQKINDFVAIINNINFIQNQSNAFVFSPTVLNPNNASGHWAHVSDITNLLVLSGNNFMIDWQPQLNAPMGCPSCVYAAPLLVILYENPTLELINVELLLNNQLNDLQTILTPQTLNPANFNKDIGMGIHSDRLGGEVNDGYNIIINNINAGTLNVEDNPTIGSGVVGNYYYQNGITVGLTDDTADNFVDGSDGLLNINNYCNNTLNNLNIKVDYIENTVLRTNNLIGFYLAYSTPCNTFSVTHSPDTTICPNIPLQLFATGGTSTGSAPAYEWLATPSSTSMGAPVLSCTDCPNPIFTGDKSTLLTVRIWNNDSCSVVRPIKVNVHPKPSLNNITTNNTDCGTSNGKVVLSAQTPIATYRLDNGTPQVGITFNDLSEGLHSLQLTDNFGCVADTFFTIKDTIRTIAKYYPSPGFGYLPLEVAFLNQSSFASTYDWKIENTFVDELGTYTFDSAGVYNITLYAWQFDATCVDSFSLKISVYDNFSFAVPNIFSPNEDGKNDSFGLTSSNEVEITYEIFNRWGNLVARGTNSGKGFVVLWDGTTTDVFSSPPPLSPSKGGNEYVTEGTYYYKLSISLKEELLLPEEKQKDIIDQTDFPIKAEGWVQVSR